MNDAGQRPVAVQRHAAGRPSVGLDELERDLRSVGRLGGELSGGVADELLELLVKGCVSHMRRFAVREGDPSRRAAACSFAPGDAQAATIAGAGSVSVLASSTASSGQLPPSHSSPYARMSSISGTSARPLSVRAYSTRGGTSGKV